jgi:ectoine hydroxylase-related dioxygenase (phytanoyl-CoA dioxygenase family)
MNVRRDKLLKRIDVGQQMGLEIGALDRPIVSLNEGRIRYVDWTTTEELKRSRANDPTVNVDAIVPVHYVWGKRTLTEAVGEDAPVDYVVASHMVEHVPDLIGWLQEVAAVLKPGGIVSFIVPDKRYTFDRLRPVSQPAEMVEAFLEKRRKPSFRQIFEHYALHTRVDLKAAWEGQVDDALLTRVHDERHALQVCRDAQTKDDYVDSHCWVFTPESFVTVLRALTEMDLLDFRVVEFFPTVRGEMDFFVTLERMMVRDVAWQLASLPVVPDETPSPVPWTRPSVGAKEEPSTSAAARELSWQVVRKVAPDVTPDSVWQFCQRLPSQRLRDRLVAAALPLPRVRPPVPGDVLWLDGPDAFEELHRRATNHAFADHSARMIRDGVTKLSAAIPAEWCDDVVREFRAHCAEHRGTLSDYRDTHGHHEPLVNFHAGSNAAMRIGTEPGVMALLDFLLGFRAAVYTSLLFEKGSQQAIHHDAPSLRTEPAGFSFGVWIALEDVHADAGPLNYYRGGHRVRLDRSALFRELGVGAAEAFHEYGRRVEAECQRRGLKLDTPPMSKGDVLIWHPWLPHGDSPIRNPALTRNSLMFHYIAEGTAIQSLESFFDPSHLDPNRKLRLMRTKERYYADMGPPTFAHNH